MFAGIEWPPWEPQASRGHSAESLRAVTERPLFLTSIKVGHSKQISINLIGLFKWPLFADSLSVLAEEGAVAPAIFFKDLAEINLFVPTFRTGAWC